METARKIAILATDGVERSELEEPRKCLLDSGFVVQLLTLGGKAIRTWSERSWSAAVKADGSIEGAQPQNFNALLIPGGVISTDALRMSSDAIRLVRTFVQSARPVAAIGHGPQLLIEAGVLPRMRVTSHHAIKTDLLNAGAEWVDVEVMIERFLVTARSPVNLSSFNRVLLRSLHRLAESSFYGAHRV